MKANEMPERIYIFDYNDAMVTPLEGDTTYVREDAFIEKAIAWLKENAANYVSKDNQGEPYLYRIGLADGFINAMKN